jgi:hypothetical protein
MRLPNIVEELSSNYSSELTKCPRGLKTKYIERLKRPYCGVYAAYRRNKIFIHIFPYNLTIVDVLLCYLEIFCRPALRVHFLMKNVYAYVL